MPILKIKKDGVWTEVVPDAVAENTAAIEALTSTLETKVDEAEVVTNDSIAAIKDVPENALPHAELTEIGGMTKKCENLIPFPYTYGGTGYSATINGVTFTVQDDGSVVANGTATANAIFIVANYSIPLAAGTYTISGVPSTGSAMTFMIQGAGRGGVSAANNIKFEGDSFTTAEDIEYLLQIVVFNGYTANNLVFKPMLNEGNTAHPHELFFEGLRSAPVSAVESVGANLIPFPYDDKSKTVNGLEFTVNDDNTIVVTGTCTQQVDFLIHYNTLMRVTNGTYILSGVPKGAVGSLYAIVNGKIFNSTTTGEQFDVTDGSLQIALTYYSGQVVNETIKPMLNKGSTAKPHAPYVKRTLEIPEAVQALDGYGWGVSDEVYNYIDYDKKQFVKRVGGADMGMISWSDTAYPNTFRSGVNNLKAPDIAIERAAGFIITKYPPSSNVDYTKIDDKSAIRYQANILVRDSDYADVASFKAAMSGVMLYYELAEPVITDISDILGVNSIPVEEGGTVTLINEYNYDVPNKINFYTSDNVQEAIGAKKLIGELIGNASTASTLSGLTTTVEELNYVNGVTSNIQEQLDAKASTNTTYTLTKSGSIITLSGSDGSSTSVTDSIGETVDIVEYGPAGADFGLVKSGGDVTISDGVITVNDDSHNHTIANIDHLQSTLDGKSAKTHTHTVSHTPAGTVSTPTITVTPNTTTVNSITGVGSLPSLTYTADVTAKSVKSWSAGSVPSLTYSAVEADNITAWSAGTLPSASLSGGSASLTGSVSNGPNRTVTLSLAHSNPTLTFNAGTLPSLTYSAVSADNITAWSAGSVPSLTTEDKTASKITAWSAGSLPTKGSNTTVVTSIKSATSTQPTFTGTAATLTTSAADA